MIKMGFLKTAAVFGLIFVVFFASALGCKPKPIEPPEIDQTPPEVPVPLSDSQIQNEIEAIINEALDQLALSKRELVFKLDYSVKNSQVILKGETSSELLQSQIVDKVKKIKGVVVIDGFVSLPSPELEMTKWGIISRPVVNLGDAPGQAEGDHTVTQARMGDIVKLLRQSDNWYFISMWDSYLGWVPSECLSIGDRAWVDEFFEGPVGVVKSKMASAFDAPDGDQLFEKRLVQGSVLPVVESSQEWTVLELPTGERAYVKSGCVEQHEGLDSVFAEGLGAEGVIDTASQYIDLPYLWGGCTSYGFDCSGFTQFAFRVNGYSLRRDADLQYLQGVPVNSQADLLPGDLVFFQTYREGASHVGIYMGDSRYIHSGGDGVSVNSFDSSHSDYSSSLSQKYLGARRVIK